MEEFIPHEVSRALYDGISDRIKKLRSTNNRNSWSDYDSHSYLSLPVAIEWYRVHCVTSGKYLQRDYEMLTKEIEGKYFLYDWYKHNRFTLRYESINGEIIEDKNRLMDRKAVDVDELVVGQVLKIDGLYVRIIKTFELINDEYGCFIAQTLSVPELIKMKKGEH